MPGGGSLDTRLRSEAHPWLWHHHPVQNLTVRSTAWAVLLLLVSTAYGPEYGQSTITAQKPFSSLAASLPPRSKLEMVRGRTWAEAIQDILVHTMSTQLKISWSPALWLLNPSPTCMARALPPANRCSISGPAPRVSAFLAWQDPFVCRVAKITVPTVPLATHRPSSPGHDR